MLKNLSADVKFYCMNGHEAPVLMKVREQSEVGNDNFFACPKYMLKDESHPDGHDEKERSCLNRLSLSDAGDILSLYNKIVEDNIMDNALMDYEGYEFRHKLITARVLKDGSKGLAFGIYNKKAIQQ